MAKFFQNSPIKKASLFLIFCLSLLFLNPKNVLAFCGFFVAKVDAEMFNNRSEVAIAHQGNKTTYSLAFNYKGDPQEFALVLPVPVVLKKQDVRVISANLFQRLNDFTAPRLVRYNNFPAAALENRALRRTVGGATRESSVQVIERFTVGEYDIVVLSATESNALETWLQENEYQLPRGAAGYLQPYIDKNLFFFVVKVNLEVQERFGFKDLRPLQFTVANSREIMLPFQLGKINSEGTQSVIVYFLSVYGRAEASNYTNVMIPSNFAIPESIEPRFGEFYKDLLSSTIKATGRETVVTEYAWDTSFCDPCSTEPIYPNELQELGINRDRAFITRLHLQYEKDTYNEDLIFRVTGDKRTHQGRYILTPENALVEENSSESAEVRAPYGRFLSGFRLRPLFDKYER